MDLVYNLARRCALPGSDIDDLVQETFLHALVGWRAHRRPDRVGVWLATICLNLARSDYRRRQRRPIEILAPDPGRDAASTIDPAGQALSRLQREAIAKAIWELPEEQRIAVALCDLCGFSAAEAAHHPIPPRDGALPGAPGPQSPGGNAGLGGDRPCAMTRRPTPPPTLEAPCPIGKPGDSRPTSWSANPAGMRSPWAARVGRSWREPASLRPKACGSRSAWRWPGPMAVVPGGPGSWSAARRSSAC